MAAHARILALPVELLQHISRFTTPEALLQLRLACTELSAAAFDAFAAEYLQTVSACVASPPRLQRLRDMVFNRRLARKVRNVVLCVDVWEGCPNTSIHLAPSEHTRHRFAQALASLNDMSHL